MSNLIVLLVESKSMHQKSEINQDFQDWCDAFVLASSTDFRTCKVLDSLNVTWVASDVSLQISSALIIIFKACLLKLLATQARQTRGISNSYMVGC